MRRTKGVTEKPEKRQVWPRTVELLESFGALDQILQACLVRVARLARVNDGDLAVFSRFDKLGESASIDVGDESLLVAVIDKHLVIDLDALVARGAAWCFDVGLVG